MPRVIITAELSDTLRNLRVQNKIQAKAVAEHIDKSPAYISKLEKAEIRTIDIEELTKILRFITQEESDTKSAEAIYNSLVLRYTKEEIEDQLWFTNFDTIIRMIPIPSDLIDEINKKITELGITRSYLTSRINANESIPEEERSDDTIAFNQWYCTSEDGYKHSIKMHVSEEKINNILDKKEDVTSYMVLFCIVFYLKKITAFSDTENISDESYKSIYDDTTKELNSYKFYSLTARNQLYKDEAIREDKDFNKIYSSFDLDNRKYILEILSKFFVASEIDIKNTNLRLEEFTKNLEWDLGFMLRLISFGYKDLKDISISNRKELLGEIDKLIMKYKEIPSSQNLIEDY